MVPGGRKNPQILTVSTAKQCCVALMHKRKSRTTLEKAIIPEQSLGASTGTTSKILPGEASPYWTELHFQSYVTEQKHGLAEGNTQAPLNEFLFPDATVVKVD